ncbi:MAG: ankyrin repeat domain-containing protein [Planctomycetota bacterium]
MRDLIMESDKGSPSRQVDSRLETFSQQWRDIKGRAGSTPDLSSFLSLPVSDEPDSRELIRVDYGNRDRLELDCSWSHYQSTIGPIDPESRVAKLLLELEIERFRDLGVDEPFSAIRDQVSDAYWPILDGLESETSDELFAPSHEGRPALQSTTDSAAVDSSPPQDAQVLDVTPTMPGNTVFAALEAGEIEKIGQYRPIRRIGSGAMGEVWLAENTTLRGLVALKILKTSVHGRQQIELALAEARAAFGIDHPNIIKVLDAGKIKDGPGLIVQQLAYDPNPNKPDGVALGVRLSKLRKDNVLTPTAVAEIMSTVCLAVAAAHGQGRIHRDIKPANILVTPESHRPMLLDFGLASTQRSQAPTSQASGLEAAGQTLGGGTPEYSSIEQLAGDPSSPAMDIWALGVTLFELLGGQRPYADLGRFRDEFPDAPDQAIAKDFTEQIRASPSPAPSSVRPGIPGVLDRICQKALCLQPLDRYISPLQMADDLNAWRNHRPTSFDTSRGRRLRLWYRRNRAWATTAASLILTLIVLTTIYVQSIQAEQRRTANERDRVRIEQAKTVAERDEKEFQRLQAVAARDEAEAVTRLMQEALMTNNPFYEESEVTMPNFLAGISDRVSQIEEDEPMVAGRIHSTLGLTHHSLGDFDKAIFHHNKAYSLRRAVVGESDARVVASLHNELTSKLASSAYYSGDVERMKTDLTWAVEHFSSVLGDSHDKVYWAKANLLFAEARANSQETFQREIQELSSASPLSPQKPARRNNSRARVGVDADAHRVLIARAEDLLERATAANGWRSTGARLCRVYLMSLYLESNDIDSAISILESEDSSAEWDVLEFPLAALMLPLLKSYQLYDTGQPTRGWEVLEPALRRVDRMPLLPRALYASFLTEINKLDPNVANSLKITAYIHNAAKTDLGQLRMASALRLMNRHSGSKEANRAVAVLLQFEHEQGNSLATALLGAIFMEGLPGIDKNIKNGVWLAKNAKAQGEIYGAYFLGIHYAKSGDHLAAYENLNRVVDTDHAIKPSALTMIAYLIPRHPAWAREQGLDYLEVCFRAAAAGSAASLSNAGRAYNRGELAPLLPDVALTCLYLAAIDGFPEAQRVLLAWLSPPDADETFNSMLSQPDGEREIWSRLMKSMYIPEVHRAAGWTQDNLTEQTPLFIFAAAGQHHAVRYMLNRGAAVNEPGPRSFLPIHMAVFHGNPESVGLLLDAGADVNRQEGLDGDTPLHIAIKKRDKPLVERLLDSGSDTLIENRFGLDALEVAQASGDRKIVDLIRNARANPPS